MMRDRDGKTLDAVTSARKGGAEEMENGNGQIRPPPTAPESVFVFVSSIRRAISHQGRYGALQSVMR